MHFFHRDYLIADRFVSERRRGRSKGTSVGGVQTPRQDRSLFAVYNKIRRSKIGPSANILMQPLGGLIEKSVIKARPRRSKWMYYCACNNIFFLFSHFFPFELNYRSRGILCEATIFLSCSSIQTTQRWFSTRETSSFAGNLFLPLLTRLLSKGRWILEGMIFLLEGIFDLPITRTFYSFLSVWGKGLKDKRETNNISLYLSLGRCLWGAFNFRPSSFLPTIRGWW